MTYLFDPPAIASLPVMGDERRFPVRRIFCIGRNYADHAREMGATVERSHPVFFTKPTDALVADGGDVPYPSATGQFHHEVEMVVALRHGGRDVDEASAQDLVFGYGIGLDLTRRDLQAAAKKRGQPWDTAKGLDHGAPVSAIVPASVAQPSPATTLSLSVNGQLHQQSTLDAMLWSVPEIIAELSWLFELKPGDLIFTGTPAGVGPLERGDRFHAELAGIATLDGRIV
ncbi:MAG TPA: fumarylacetoacetate hydrolase family protein [Rhodanobacteraceae bacterium]